MEHDSVSDFLQLLKRKNSHFLKLSEEVAISTPPARLQIHSRSLLGIFQQNFVGYKIASDSAFWGSQGFASLLLHIFATDGPGPIAFAA